MTKKMNAYGFYDPQKEQNTLPFEKIEMAIPEPKDREILVEVKAVSVNPTDLATRMMKKSSDESFTILGRDVSGTVKKVGKRYPYSKRVMTSFILAQVTLLGLKLIFMSSMSAWWLSNQKI